MDGFAYVDIARSGEANMAIDRQLLETAERDQCAWVRLYRWSEPTLSLGRFQASLDRGIHPPSAELPAVLRASGGGAIVHHHEWTYSIAVPVGRNRVGAAPHLYDLVHDSLVAGLSNLGWAASKWTAQSAAEPQAPACHVSSSAEPREVVVGYGGSGAVTGGRPHFLCFSRRSCGDIICNGFKVVGSAQRRLGSSVLQHGSILLARSQFAPELAGLCDLPREPPSSPGIALEKSQRLQSDYSAAAHLEATEFAGLVLSWLTVAISGHAGVSFSLPPIRPEARKGPDE